jgi:hypothetical protein
MHAAGAVVVDEFVEQVALELIHRGGILPD